MILRIDLALEAENKVVGGNPKASSCYHPKLPVSLKLLVPIANGSP